MTMWVGPEWEGVNNIFEGKILTAVLQPFTDVLGPWFYVLIAGFFLSILYIKTQNLGMISVVGLILSFAMLAFLPPSIRPLLYIMLAASMSVIIYKFFKE